MLGVSLMFMVSLLVSVNSVKARFILLVIFPVVEVLSDLLYILDTSFFYRLLFRLCVVFYFAPSVAFLYQMVYVEKLICRPLCCSFPLPGNVCWLSHEGFVPHINGVRFSFVDKKFDSILNFIMCFVSWLLLFLL